MKCLYQVLRTLQLSHRARAASIMHLQKGTECIGTRRRRRETQKIETMSASGKMRVHDFLDSSRTGTGRLCVSKTYGIPTRKLLHVSCKNLVNDVLPPQA